MAQNQAQPGDDSMSNLPADTPPSTSRGSPGCAGRSSSTTNSEGELGLDHYEGRSYLGWYHHTALVTAAHGFLTLERLHPFHQRPAYTPSSSARPTASLQASDRPLPNLPTTNQPRQARRLPTPTKRTNLTKQY